MKDRINRHEHDLGLILGPKPQPFVEEQPSEELGLSPADVRMEVSRDKHVPISPEAFYTAELCLAISSGSKERVDAVANQYNLELDEHTYGHIGSKVHVVAAPIIEKEVDGQIVQVAKVEQRDFIEQMARVVRINEVASTLKRNRKITSEEPVDYLVYPLDVVAESDDNLELCISELDAYYEGKGKDELVVVFLQNAIFNKKDVDGNDILDHEGQPIPDEVMNTRVSLFREALAELSDKIQQNSRKRQDLIVIDVFPTSPEPYTINEPEELTEEEHAAILGAYAVSELARVE